MRHGDFVAGGVTNPARSITFFSAASLGSGGGMPAIAQRHVLADSFCIGNCLGGDHMNDLSELAGLHRYHCNGTVPV